jgi:GT2 family glycosyltransferase
LNRAGRPWQKYRQLLYDFVNGPHQTYSSMKSSVAVTIVTYNSGHFIRRCLESLLEQKYPEKEIIVVDNASSDETRDILKTFEARCRVFYNLQNIGFAAGQNQALAYSKSDWVLTLNPDMLLMPGFIEQLVTAGEADKQIGTVCGKLLAISPDFELPKRSILDSTGMYFTPGLRHFDRGSQQPDEGQYDEFEYVFGATAAAALYRRAMISDISVGGEFFDSDFFIYREDADVAWRAQLLGWKCVYTPLAHAYHVRRVLPERRRTLPSDINMHSVKNRFMLRVKNVTAPLYVRNWPRITARDVAVAAACLIIERSSLRAFGILARKWKKMFAKRREIMGKKRVDNTSLNRWFATDPVSFPAEEVARHVLARDHEFGATETTRSPDHR